MEEDMDDDFGDLYGDVELSSALQVSNYNQLYQKNQNETSSNDAEGDTNLNNLDENPILDSSKDIMLDNGSDSEDDFHIVLNEDDGNGLRNVGMMMMEGSEDEEGSKDKKWVDKLPSDGFELSSAERGNGKKSSYSSQYSQYKYVRPHATPFPSSTKVSGVGVSFASPPSGRSDWDLNGSSHLVGSGSAVVSTCTTFPAVSQGCDFFLPRNRTIFDINIETFERKLWRQTGVDITDFFNFGLDEDRWKDYCNCLEQIRQQATMPTRTPFNGYNQASDPEFDHKTATPEALTQDVVSSDAIRGIRLQKIPKGKAIQVEGGIGERRPSMDVRRPRDRDSDVVIQIPVQDSDKFSSSSSKEEQWSLDKSMEEGSEKRDSDLDDNKDGHLMEAGDEYSREFNPEDTGTGSMRCSKQTFSTDRGSQENEKIRNGDEYLLKKVARNYVLEEVTDEMDTDTNGKDGLDEDFIKAGTCVSEANSSPGNRIQCSYSPSFDSQSESSEVGDDIDNEDTRKLAKMTSLNSVCGLPESVTSGLHDQKESGSDESKTGQQVCSEEHSPLQVEHNSRSRLRLRSVAELMIRSDDDEASPVSGRKGRHNRSRLNGRQRERNISYDRKDREDLSLYRQTKTSIDYSRGRFREKHVRSADTGIPRKEYPQFRDEVSPHIRRHRVEREYFLNRKDVFRDNYVMEREVYHCEQHTNGGISGITHEESIRSASENLSFYRDDEKYHRQRRRRDDYECRKGMEVDDFVYEHMYEEKKFQDDEYRRHVPYHDRENGYFQEKYDRDGIYIVNEIEKLDRRERYGGSPDFDFDDSWNFDRHDEECWRPSDHDFLPPYSYRGSHSSNERGYRYTTSPGSDVFGSRRSDGRRTADSQRLLQSEKQQRNTSWSRPNFKDHKDADPGHHGYHDGREYIWQPNLAVDNLNPRVQNRDRLHGEEAPFSCERSPRHDYIHGQNGLTCGEIMRHQYPERGKNRTVREERRSFEVKDPEAELRWRNSVDLQSVGWEGKSSGRSKFMPPWRNHRNDSIVDATDDDVTFRRSDQLYQRKFPHRLQNFGSNYSNGVATKVHKVGQSHIDHNTEQGKEKLLEKHPGCQQGRVDAVHEGRQLQVKGPETKKIADSGDAGENSENAVKDKNQRILETLAKMEKRRERFKETITVKKEMDKNPMPQSDIVVEETTEVKQMRPARKRRWGGN